MNCKLDMTCDNRCTLFSCEFTVIFALNNQSCWRGMNIDVLLRKQDHYGCKILFSFKKWNSVPYWWLLTMIPLYFSLQLESEWTLRSVISLGAIERSGKYNALFKYRGKAFKAFSVVTTYGKSTLNPFEFWWWSQFSASIFNLYFFYNKKVKVIVTSGQKKRVFGE